MDDDKDRAVALRKRILDMVATERMPVVGFHMPFPGIGYVERAGAAYRWVAAQLSVEFVTLLVMPGSRSSIASRNDHQPSRRRALTAIDSSCAVRSLRRAAALRRASSEASASCSMARNSRAGVQVAQRLRRRGLCA